MGADHQLLVGESVEVSTGGGRGDPERRDQVVHAHVSGIDDEIEHQVLAVTAPSCASGAGIARSRLRHRLHLVPSWSISSGVPVRGRGPRMLPPGRPGLLAVRGQVAPSQPEKGATLRPG